MENNSGFEAKSPYESTSLGADDPRCTPVELTDPVPIGAEIVYPEYTDYQAGTWSMLYGKQNQHLMESFCKEYAEGAKNLKFSENRIPSLKELSEILESKTGWKIARIPGLIKAEDFFSFLEQKIFPSTDYIRERHELEYTPAPDLFHDIFGHLPLLTNDSFANFYSKFGTASLKAVGEQKIQLERLHWFTVEFGLIMTDKLRIYGAGIISSDKEVIHSLSSECEVKEFNIEEVINQEYDVWHIQPILFAISSFKQLETEFESWAKKEGLL